LGYRKARTVKCEFIWEFDSTDLRHRTQARAQSPNRLERAQERPVPRLSALIRRQAPEPKWPVIY
jgi:hypothetical protein